MPNRWLVKTDPAYLPLEEVAARRTVPWQDVTQPAALAHLRRMRRGEEVLIYLTGSQRAVVATAKVRKGAVPDPEDPEGRLVIVDLTVQAPLERPVTLAELKRESTLDGWELVRVPRLLAMPVPAAAWRRVLALAKRKPP